MVLSVPQALPCHFRLVAPQFRLGPSVLGLRLSQLRRVVLEDQRGLADRFRLVGLTLRAQVPHSALGVRLHRGVLQVRALRAVRVVLLVLVLQGRLHLLVDLEALQFLTRQAVPLVLPILVALVGMEDMVELWLRKWQVLFQAFRALRELLIFLVGHIVPVFQLGLVVRASNSRILCLPQRLVHVGRLKHQYIRQAPHVVLLVVVEHNQLVVLFDCVIRGMVNS